MKTLRGELTVVVKYTPHAKQRVFHDSKSPFRAFVGGVGSGKSLAGVMEVVKYAVEYPGSRGMIVAPSYRMLRDATMDSFFKFCPPELIQEHKKGEKRIIFINGSEIWYRSADDPESLRGPNIEYFFLDEAAMCKKKTWDILLGRIRGKKGPNRAWVATTPKGFNWVYKLWVQKKQAENLEQYDIVYCSTMQNPHLPEDFSKHMKDTYAGSFYDQEVLGKFTAHEGVVYRAFNRGVHEQPISEWAERYNQNPRIIGGIDWGYANPMVCVILAVDGDGRMHMAGEVYRRRLTIPEFDVLIRSEMEEVARKLGVPKDDLRPTFYCDPADTGLGTGSMMAELRKGGWNVQKADNTVMSGINAVAKRLEGDERGPRLYIDPACVNTLSEFEQYSFDEEDPEKPYRDKPLKMNDHAMDALRYAVMSQQSGDKVIALKGGSVLF